MQGSNDESITRAIRLIESGFHDEAIKLLQDFVKEKADSLEGWYNLGYALTQGEKFEEALEAYEEALAIDNMIVAIWFNKGDVHYQLVDFKRAIECYEKVVELDPEDAEAWNNLGNCFSRLGEGREAIRAYTQAVALRPDYAEAFYNKANAHFIEEEDEHAIAYAELAVELDPDLIPRVGTWIQVARDRQAANKEHEEYERRKRQEEMR